MAGPHAVMAPVLRWAIAICMAASVAGCRPRPRPSVAGVPRPLNRVIIVGVVQTTEGTPVAGARVAAVLITEPTPSTGRCRGIPGPHGEDTSSAIGKFTIPIQMPGPQSAVCLLVKVDAPEGSGLRDTTESGPRFWYGIPPTTTIPTKHVTMVLSKE